MSYARSRYSRRRSFSDFIFDNLAVVAGVVFGLFFVGAITFGIINATHVEVHENCHVTDKDRTSGSGDQPSNMRVYTDNCGVFEVKDSWLSWTFSSADTYNEVTVDQTYDFTTRGYRIPFLSGFPNIVEVETAS